MGNQSHIKLDENTLRLIQSDLPLLPHIEQQGFLEDGRIDLKGYLVSNGLNPYGLNQKIRLAATKVGIQRELECLKIGNAKHFILAPNESAMIIERLMRNSLVYDYGLNDVGDTIYLDNGKIKPCYRKWCGMLERCYSAKWHIGKPSYKDCYVAPEWLYFSNFKQWFDEYNLEGYVLDKDILLKGNKCYSKDTCVFVPEFINTLFIRRQGNRGDLPIGVTFHQREKKYIARISAKNVRILVGRFDCPQEAFIAYKKAKEEYIKSTALDYFKRGQIDKRVYDALCAYEVEVDD